VFKQTIYLPSDLKGQLAKAALLTGVPEAHIIRAALDSWLTEQQRYLTPSRAEFVRGPKGTRTSSCRRG
jgi:hypothetical protein